MDKGLFISFEGIDGCGKSTQLQLFADYLKKKGCDVVVTREPGGTDVSEQIRSIILDAINKDEFPITEMLLFAASRAQHVAQLIRPAVEAGKIVLCDRFVDSSIAYQGFARGLGDKVRIVNEYAVDGLMPDITFLLDISVIEGRKRNSETDKCDRLEQEALDFHQKVYDAYQKLAADNPDRYIIIDASKSIEAVFDEIVEKYEQRIKK